MRNEIHDYSDIIDAPYEKSYRHKRMRRVERAAQFSSFAALVGYEDAVEETARLTDAEREITEETIEAINRKLNELAEHIQEQPEVIITHFIPDKKKSGGRYVKTKGRLKKIDTYNCKLILCEGTHISLKRVTGIE